MEEELFINPKQYHRILQRRQSRAKKAAQNTFLHEQVNQELSIALDEPRCLPKLFPKSYIYESRHNVALRRERNGLGRFKRKNCETTFKETIKPPNDNAILNNSNVTIEEDCSKFSKPFLPQLTTNQVKMSISSSEALHIHPAFLSS